MKQDVDKFTGDMFEVDEVAEHTFSKPTKQFKYRVFVALADGVVLVWDSLTRAQAMAMHKRNGENFNAVRSSTEIVRFGWEEMK